MDKKRAIEEISYIRQVMVDAKTATHDFGKFYMVWAGAVILGMSVQLTLIYRNIDSPIPAVLCWVFFMGSALVWDVKENRKLKKEKRVETFANRMLNAIWGACLVGILTALFIWPAITQGKFFHGTAVITLIMGIGHYITGEISGSRNLKLIGIFWLFSVIPILVLFKIGNMLLLASFFALLMFLFQFIPGYLHMRSQNQTGASKTIENNNGGMGNTENPLEKISQIKKLLDDTRGATLNLGSFYIFWTVLIVVAIVIETIFLRIGLKQEVLVLWGIFLLVGFIWSFRHSRELRKTATTSVFANKLVSSTWATSLTAMVLSLFPFVMIYDEDFLYGSSIVALIMGIAHYITGELSESKILKRAGIGWWVYSMLLIVTAANGYRDYIPILFTAGLIFFQLIPGYLFSRELREVRQES